jgi:hypothetical protein
MARAVFLLCYLSMTVCSSSGNAGVPVLPSVKWPLPVVVASAPLSLIALALIVPSVLCDCAKKSLRIAPQFPSSPPGVGSRDTAFLSSYYLYFSISLVKLCNLFDVVYGYIFWIMVLKNACRRSCKHSSGTDGALLKRPAGNLLEVRTTYRCRPSTMSGWTRSGT